MELLSLKQIPLVLPLSITLFFLLFSSTLFPYVKLSPFSIFLAFLYHRYPLEKCLWISALCGLTIDLFSADTRLGTQAFALSLTTLLLYRQKHHFFEDKPLVLALFAFPISVLWTALQWLIVPLSGIPFSFSPALFITDLFVMPLFDTLYALLFFCFPLLFFLYVKKVGWKGCFYEMQQKWPRFAKILPKRLRLSNQSGVQI